MIINCPHCGNKVEVNGLGRKPLNIPLKNVLESLQTHRDVTTAARDLGCSSSYIFGVLKKNDLKLNDVIKGVFCGRCHPDHQGELMFSLDRHGDGERPR
jgi:hypothetical protein